MKIKSILLVILACITISARSQNFSTLSGTIRFAGGIMGGAMVFSPMFATWLIYEGFSDEYGHSHRDERDEKYRYTWSGWIRDNHISFLRFFNAAYDIPLPQWTMSFSQEDISLDRTQASKGNTFIDCFFPNDNYINYIGYYLNWKDPFSRYGFYCGMDFELRKFNLVYNTNSFLFYDWCAHNEIQSLVPSVGFRYRLINPGKEIEGFPFNIVLEAGLSYAIIIKYVNDLSKSYALDYLTNYGMDVLNNGFRLQLGIALTTNRWGSLYIRWNKDLYNLYNNDNIAKYKNGYLYNNTIKTNLSCFSIGWATFL